MDARTARHLLALHRRTNRTLLHPDLLRQARASLRRHTHQPRDPAIVHHWTQAALDSATDYLIICADTHTGVMQVLRRNGLSLEAIPAPRSAYDCTGRVFGGEPEIRQVHPGRWRVIYHWYCDV